MNVAIGLCIRAMAPGGAAPQSIASLAFLPEMLQDKDPVKSQRVMQAIMQMKKLDIAGLEKAYRNGDESEAAQHALLAADIKRFLERPAEPMKPQPPTEAPPGAPIGGDSGMDWLAPPMPKN